MFKVALLGAAKLASVVSWKIQIEKFFCVNRKLFIWGNYDDDEKLVKMEVCNGEVSLMVEVCFWSRSTNLVCWGI